MEPLFIGVLTVVVLLVLVVVVLLTRRSTAAPPVGAPIAPVDTLADRLTNARRALGERLRVVFGREALDEDFWVGLEEALLAADVGVEAAGEVVGRVRGSGPETAEEAKEALRRELLAILAGRTRTLRQEGSPTVVVVVGVNGVGKTTSIAKLAARFHGQGAATLLAAADTFRAAADTQLKSWAERVGAELVAGEPGGDPAAVAFDAYQAARARGKDVVIVDTAGRLHSKHNLMQELGKIVRVLERAAGRVDEVLLVLDATTGQNGITQTEVFTEAVGVTGIVLAKMDGTARGGIALAVERRLGIPVKFIGVGEGVEDLVPFEAGSFVDALLGDV